ncbi:MAG: RNA polymerase sigma factor [Rubrobacteraceae bacterium]
MILACRKGDARAWRVVLKRYERLVYSIPLNYGLSREDAADISQLTFSILIKSMDSLRDDSRLGAWLATVARRHSWRLMEKNRREGTRGSEDLAESDLAESAATLFGKNTSGSLERWEVAEWLNGGLDELDERCRELLVALYFDEEEPSYGDISDRMDMPVGSIGPTRARCLARLKKILEDGK